MVCDIMLPAVLAITHTLTTYYFFSGLAVKGLSDLNAVVVNYGVFLHWLPVCNGLVAISKGM